MKRLSLCVMLSAILIITVQGQTKPEMIKVKGGTYNMGYANDPLEHSGPVHSVTLSNFAMSKYPITVAEYKAFCNATNRLMPAPPSWGWNDTNPIVNVSYNDAVDYCNWLSTLNKATYRLPTEAEYEYAARGGNKKSSYTYSGSNDMNEAGWYVDNSEGRTHSVGLKKPNELGLYDMCGNIWEWCKDWWTGIYNADSVSNPQGLPVGKGSDHITRGGSWSGPANYCKVYVRRTAGAKHTSADLGFRVVSVE